MLTSNKNRPGKDRLLALQILVKTRNSSVIINIAIYNETDLNLECSFRTWSCNLLTPRLTMASTGAMPE